MGIIQIILAIISIVKAIWQLIKEIKDPAKRAKAACDLRDCYKEAVKTGDVTKLNQLHQDLMKG